MTSLNVKLQIEYCSWNEISGKDVKLITVGTCKICQLDDNLLLLIGDITYALKQGMPVVLQSANDRMVFVFQSKEDGILYGLSAKKSSSATEFKAMLKGMMLLEESKVDDEKKEEKENSSKAKKYGNKLAGVISKGGKLGLDVIDRGTVKTKDGIHILTKKAKGKIPQREKPVEVSDNTKAKIEKAKMASVMAVTVSSSLVKGALESATQMSDQLKPVLSDYLEKKGLKTDKQAGPKTKAAVTVGKQSVRTALELYLAMKDASVVLMAATIDAGAELVEHRYGTEAGAAARDVAKAGKNALEASKNIGGIGLKSGAKKVLTDTVVKSLDSPEKARKVEEQKEAAAVLAETSLIAPPLEVRENSAALEMD